MSLLVGGELLLYGDVGDPFGFGDGFTPRDVALALAEHGPGPLTARINSGGGIAADGVTIHSLLAARGDVTIVIDGTAASAASVIAMAGSVRRMRAGASLMIHDLAAVTWGNAADHQQTAGVLDKLSEQYAGLYALAAGAEASAMRALMKAETWFTPDEALAAGLVTEIEAGPAATAHAFDYRIYARAPAGLPQRDRPTAAAPPPASIEDETMTKTWVDKFFAAAESTAVPLAKLNAIVGASETLEAAQAALITAQAEPTETALDPAAASPAGSAAEAEKAWAGEFFAAAEKTTLPLAKLNEIVANAGSLAAAQAQLINAMAATGNAGKPGPGAADPAGADDRATAKASLAKAVQTLTGAKAPAAN